MIVTAETRRATAVVVHHHAGQLLALDAVEHLHVEVGMPAEPVSSPDDLHILRHAAPLSGDHQNRVAPTDSTEQVTRPLLGPGDIHHHGVVYVTGDPQVSGGH